MMRSRSRVLGLLAILCIAILAVYKGRPDFSNASKPARGIADSVTALQLARNVDEVDDVLGEAPSPDREAMRIKQYIDFAFIPAYVALYAAVGLLFGSRLGVFVAVCGVATGIFDVIENFGILRILDVPLSQTTQAMVDSIRHPSLAKWTLAACATAGVGWLFWRAGGWIMRLIGGLNLIAAALVFCGLFDNALLVPAGLPTLAGLILVAIFGVWGRLKAPSR